MDQEDDIPTKGTPGEDGYDPAGDAPFAPHEEEAEEQSAFEEGSEDAGEEPDISDLDNTARTLEELQESDEPPQPVGSEGGDPKLDATTPAAGGSEPNIPFEPEQAAPDSGIGFSEDVPPEDIPSTETHTEEAAPDLEGLDGGDEGGMEAFGNQLEAFNEAGGAGGGFGGGAEGAGGGGAEDGLQQFAEANTQLHTTQFDFLKDHARALSDLQRRLEIERL